MRKALFVLGAAMCTSACFAITHDVDGLHGPAPVPPHLAMSFTKMDQHEPQRFEFVVVDRNNFVQTRGIVLHLDTLAMTDGQFKISVPLAVPIDGDGYRVDFWADETGNGTYDYNHDWETSQQFSQLDHSWRVLLDGNPRPDPYVHVTHAVGTGSYAIEFEHHLDFVDLWEFPDRQPPRRPPNDTGANAVVDIDSLAADGRLAQIRIADPSGHVVGLLRFRTSTQPVELTIPGCVEPGNFYDVDLYVDANGNNDANGNGYDDPSKGSGDLGWRLLHQRAGDAATGLRVTLHPDTATGNVDVGPP